MPLPEKEAFKPSEITPLHLTASTTLASNSAGGVNAVSLKNPLGTPMEILEIKWQLRCTNFALSGGSVGCKLELGKIPLTNGFVPVWNFGRALNVDQGEIPRDFNIALLIPGITGERYNEYTWKLPRPLYIPPGAVVMPTFQHRGYINENVSVRISYSARSLPAGYKPKTINVPWVSSYVSKVFDKMGAADTDQSNETEVVNPFDEPINIQHFVGRIASYDRNAPTDLVIDDVDVGGRLLTLRAMDSEGEAVIPKFSLFHSVFNLPTRSWNVVGTVPPKMFYSFFLAKAAPAVLDADTFQTQAFMSMVGWREMRAGVP